MVSRWKKLFIKVLAYYVALLAGLGVVLYLFPALEAYVPVGGLEAFSSANTLDEVVSTLREQSSSDTVFRGVYRLVEALVMSISIGLTLLTMWPVVWVFRATREADGSKKSDATVMETLVVLPIIITAVVLIIQNSIALAFGLAGIVAGVQYRNRLARSIDAAYLFAAIAVGIASGIEAVGVGIMMCMWFCLTIIGMRIARAPTAAVTAEDADRRVV